MKVRELIELLEQLDPEHEVVNSGTRYLCDYSPDGKKVPVETVLLSRSRTVEII